MKLSCRHFTKFADFEPSSKGVNVSAGARKYVRNAIPEYRHLRNYELNELIADDFLKLQPWTRFKLTKTFQGIAEVRKSDRWVYIAMIRGRGTAQPGYDIITIQPNSKEVSEELRKVRLQPGWGID